MVETLYERIGGAQALESAVHGFYDRVLTDPLVAPAFHGVDLVTLRHHMTLYLTETLAAPDVPSTWDLAAAHRHLRISDAMFDAVVGHLAAELEQVVVDPALVDDVVECLAAQRSLVVTAVSAERRPPPRGSGVSR